MKKTLKRIAGWTLISLLSYWIIYFVFLPVAGLIPVNPFLIPFLLVIAFAVICGLFVFLGKAIHYLLTS